MRFGMLHPDGVEAHSLERTSEIEGTMGDIRIVSIHRWRIDGHSADRMGSGEQEGRT